MRRVAARRAPARQLGARARLPADADPRDRALRERVERHRHEARTPARRLAGGATLDRLGGEGGGSDGHDGRADEQEDAKPPAGPVQRDRERHREECDEARLRVREVEAPEEERDDGCRGHPVDRAPLADEDDNEQNGDRDDEVAAVQARVPEERGDAEERGVGVRDLDVAGEEHRARLRLPEPDGREERAERHERQEQRPREPGRERRPAGDGERGGEREQEERERDASVPLVPRPQERDRRERDEGRQRKGEEEGRRRRALATYHAVREREGRGREHEVERQEEERILLPDLDGYPEGRGGEEDDRDDRRVARERDRPEHRGEHARSQERDALGLDEDALHVVIAHERSREPCRRDAEKGDPHEGEKRSRGTSASTAPSAPRTAATWAASVCSIGRNATRSAVLVE